MRALARASIAVALLAALAALTAAALADSPRQLTPVFARESAKQAPALREQPRLRTRTSRTFATRDGSYSTRLYEHPVNYRSGKRWLPIDNTLEPSNSPRYALENGANRYSLRLPSSLGDAPVRIDDGPRWLAFSLAGAQGRAAAKSSTATYANALPGVNVAYTAGGDSVKEDLQLAGPDSAASYRFDVATSPGLTAKRTRAGGIDFVDKRGARHFSFTPPFMRDSAGAVSTAVKMRIRRVAGGYVVTVNADRGWLRAPARRFPVVVDPTTRVVGNGEDCYLVGGSVADTHFCGYAYNWLDVGNGGGPNGQDPRRTFLKFDTSAVPSEATVLYAELGLYSEAGTTRTVNVNRLTRWSSSSRTWNTYDGTSRWTTPGGDISSSPDASNSSVGGSTAGWFKWYPSELAQGWVNGSVANNGMLLSSPTTFTNDALHFRATEQTGFEPYLTVRWEYPTGVLDGYPLETDQVSTNLTQKVNVAAGNLILDQTDLSLPADGMDFDFHRYFNGCDIWTFELGQGWKTNTDDIFVSQYGDYDANGAYRRIVLWLPSFAPLAFERQSDGSYKPPRGFDGKLVRNADGSKTVTWYDEGITWNFSPGGTLRSEVTPDGKQLTFTYDAASNLTSITDVTGAITRFTYTSNAFLKTMTDPTGKVTTYGYYNDASGNPRLPSTVTDPTGKVTRYVYDGNDNLTQLTGPDGSIRKYTYDSASRITSSTQVTDPVAGTGPKTTFTYGSGYTTVTRPDGSTKKYTYYPDLFSNKTEAGTSPPAVALTGTLGGMEDKTLTDGSTYTLNVAATDPGSGVKSVEIQVDDQQEDFNTQTCAAGGCSMSRSYTFDGSDFEPGESVVKVIATSQNGAETVRQFRVTVPGDFSTMPASDETVDSAPELADDTALRPAPFEGESPDPTAVAAARSTVAPVGTAGAGPTGTALFSGMNAAGTNPTAAPGDSVGAIGLDRYIEIQNRLITMYDRSALGTALRNRRLSEWIGVNNAYDPQILWDQRQQRYFYAAAYETATGGNGLAFGWSTNAHPADLSRTYWCKMVTRTSSLQDDYPKFAVSRDWMIVGTNVYDAAEHFQRSRIRVAKIPKKGDTTCPKNRELHLKTFNVRVQNPGAPSPTSAFTPVPVRTFSVTNRGGYVMAADFRSFGTGQVGGTRLLFWRVVTKRGKPRLRSGVATTVTVPAFSVPPRPPQNGSYPLDQLEARLYQAFGDTDPSNGKFEIWTAHTIAAGSLSGARWYEVAPPGSASPALKQSGTIDATTEAAGTQTYLFNPAIAPAANGGDAVIQYNVSRPDLPPVIHARSRHSGDPAGQFGPPFAVPTPASTTPLRTASNYCSENGVQTCRWGDYSSALPDPNNSNVVWGTNQWVGPDGTYRSENFALRPSP